MEFREVVKRRRMARHYRDAPVDEGALARVLDAGRRAPSAGFAQGVEFVVVTSLEGRQRIAAAAGEPDYVARGFAPWLSSAPVHVVIAVDPDRYHARYSEPDKRAAAAPDDWPAPYWWVDAGAAMMLLLLAVVEEGLAAGFLGSHAISGLGSIVDLPPRREALGVITIGHPARGPVSHSARRRRRSSEETIHWERWQPPAP